MGKDILGLIKKNRMRPQRCFDWRLKNTIAQHDRPSFDTGADRRCECEWT
jgi:hypothetical protein